MLSLDLVDKGLVTDQLVVTVGYDIENLTDPKRRMQYHGAIVTDGYGRQIPKHAHGTINLNGYTASTEKILSAVSTLFDRIVDKTLLVRRLNLTANHVIPETSVSEKTPDMSSLICSLIMRFGRQNGNKNSTDWNGKGAYRKPC